MFEVMADGSRPAAARAAFDDSENLSAADELLPCPKLLSFVTDDDGAWNIAIDCAKLS